jgi:hypothetical protein
MKIAERTATWRRERRLLLRVSRAAWRLEQAERERSWALASARAEGVSIRALAAAAGLSSSRVHQIVAAADLDELDAALGELRAAGWPAPVATTEGGHGAIWVAFHSRAAPSRADRSGAVAQLEPIGTGRPRAVTAVGARHLGSVR